MITLIIHNNSNLGICINEETVELQGSYEILRNGFDFTYDIILISDNLTYLNLAKFYVYDSANTMLTNGINFKETRTTAEINGEVKNIIVLKFTNIPRIGPITLVIEGISESEITTNSVSTSASISQSTDVICSIPIVNPYIKSNTKTKYVDAARNRDQTEYTYYSTIAIDDSYKKFGIKREHYFGNDIYEYNIDEKPNIAGQVVVLNPVTIQTQIYSFKNGEQFVELNKESAKKDFLLPHYMYSYEYKIEGIADEDDGVNIKFYGANGYTTTSSMSPGFSLKEIVNAYNKISDDTLRNEYLQQIYSTYYFYASYVYCEGSYSYTHIPKTGKIEKNDGETTIFEATYTEITNDISTYFSYIDVFELKKREVKIDNEIFEYDEYVKVASDKLPENNESQVQIPTKYMQEFEYELVDKNEVSKDETLYIKNDTLDIYVPIQPHITADGTVQYYGLTYVECENINFDQRSESEYFIKQKYREITEEEFEKTDNSLLYTYIGDTPFAETPVKSSDYIYDLDVSGNTIYCNDDGEVISFDDLKELYYEKEQENPSEWYSKNINEERVKSNLSSMLLTNYGIQYTVNYDGNWKKIKISENTDADMYLSVSSENGGHLYVKEEGFSKVDPRLIPEGYKVKIYENKIGKISASEVKLENQEEEYYIDVTKYDLNTDGSNIIEAPDGKIIAKLNKLGFAEGVNYYKRTPVFTPSQDQYRFLNKDYWQETELQKQIETPLLPLSLLKDKDATDNIFDYEGDTNSPDNYMEISSVLAETLIDEGILYTYEGTSFTNVTSTDVFNKDTKYYIQLSTYLVCNSVDNVYELQLPTNYSIGLSKYSYDFTENNFRFFRNKVSHYMMSKEYANVSDIRSYDKQFLKSKYFYPQFSINNGIHITKDGSYYTTISIYDGTRGVISKSLVLQPNIFNVTQYTYDYTASSLVEVQDTDDLDNVNPNNYKDYCVMYEDTFTNEITYLRLSNETESPAYWAEWIDATSVFDYSTTYKLLKNKEIKKTVVFDGRTLDMGDHLEIQYFDNYSYEPCIIKKNDLMFGIILNQYRDTTPDNKIIDEDSKLIYGPESSSNPYKYDVVELKETIYDEETTEVPTVYQEQTTSTKILNKPVPFYLANEKNYVFSGTYTWINPKHSYLFSKVNDKYEAVDVIKNLGYWKRNYNESSIPLTIASYNFYVNKDEISSTTATYMYIPMSYVISAVIDHPKISYNYIISEKKEVERYSYILNGNIYDYKSDGIVQDNGDGTFVGTIEVNGESILVNLIKNIDVINISSVKEVIHQNSFTSYEKFSYKNAIALTNEKIPSLYNIELIPASTHKVQYWNEDASTYAIKTVVDSYAYYVYNYKYETVPFEVSSYIYSPNALNIAGLTDLGTTIENGINSISSSIENVVSNVSSISDSLTSSSNEIKQALEESSNTIGSYLTSMKNSIVNSLNNINGASVQNESPISGTADEEPNFTGSYIISYAINDMTSEVSDKMQATSENITYSINALPDRIVQSIDDNLSAIKESLDELKPTKVPTYEEFMIDLVPKLYAKSDFEEDIIETETKDENGNIITSMKHKPSPVELAKKSIYRADILWNEMKKKGLI